MERSFTLISDPLQFTELQDYLEQIESGEQVVGEWMKKNLAFVEYGLENKKFYYCPEKAKNVIRFIETQVVFIAHRKGHFILEKWQKYVLACMYGLVDESGVRHFSEFVFIIGRKQGKSALFGATEVYHAFCQDQDGMQLYNLAPKLKQARIIYNQFLTVVERNKYLSRRGHKKIDEYEIKSKNCLVSPLALNSKKGDGFDPSFTIFDEFAAWEGDKSKKMYEVISSGQGAQAEPMNIFCSTANYIDNGLYDEIFRRATAVLNGNSEDESMLPFMYMIDDINKWDDIQELRKALPNLGVSFLEKRLKEEIAKAHESISYQAEFITKYCNIKQNATTAWLTADDVRSTQCDELTPDMFSNMYGTAGVDLSRTTDLTAATISIVVDSVTYYLSHFWLPKDGIEKLSDRDNENYALMAKLGFLTLSGKSVIDYRDITDWFLEMRDTYHINIMVVGYDRYSAEYWVNEMREKGFEMDDVYQGTNLTPIIYQFEGRIHSGLIRTGTNGLLQSHLMNSAVKMASGSDSADNRIRLVKYDPRKHIDGMASVLDAETVRDKWSDKYADLFGGNTWEEKHELVEQDFSVF